MTEEKHKAIQQEIKRGEKALAAAKLLCEQGLYEDAVSRAYYAVLHLAKAALLSRKIKTSTHKGIIAMFGLHLVKEALIDREFAEILAKEKEDREIGDYDVLVDIESDRAWQRISEAEKFVKGVKQFLRQSGIQGN